MKTLYQKIGVVLTLGFILQIISFGVFYKHVVTNRVISEINYQEKKRQTVMQEAIADVQKVHKRQDKLEKSVEDISKKYKVYFIIKDENGGTIYSTKSLKNQSDSIQEQGYVKVSGKISYVIYGYFPETVINNGFQLKGQTGRILIATIIITVSIIILIIIYRFIADPLKKLSKAVNDIQYGNTVIEIPYYGDDELGVLCRNFEEMGKRLKKSEDNQQELIQAISHDIKTPLTSIIGYSKRLVEGKVKDDKQIQYHNIIYNKAIELKLLLEELEDYSNINSVSKYSKEPVNCRKMFEQLNLELEEEIEGKEAQLHYLNRIDENIILNFDVKKMKRVFINLIHNSLKYAGDNCIINITGISKDTVLRFEISDNGEGVPKEHLNKIFDRFYRIDSSRSREKGGTGLGLAICKDIVENHGGQIRAENLPTKGFSIIIEFKI
ncbi:HAMP domain-containing sensor histidine kinase [Clostridium sp. OS1-26]|uniref:HAMP domain-containing sensor histidine kinase n=1 Tax=Clostridium sp. OS1-26 TaxID=3070681 RepID=UPI0027DF0532|nr:HAMP domain-containing sensor histidine kinase [Clostridium sp. OS1-26]WML33094.1 HAMP domain-containing sensor histidine kinase [Clostridium sp. OS1-26]